MNVRSERPHLMPVASDVKDLVLAALDEDLKPLGDLTSSLLDRQAHATGEFVARQDGVVAGCLCVEETFVAVDPSIELEWKLVDGDQVESGQVIGVVKGPIATMLTAERTALNFMSHLSGIASNAAKWVEIASGRVTVWDTRKTLPGYRSLQKAAVRAGGAVNHRGNLSDWLMIKDNHLTGTTVKDSVSKARTLWPGRVVHVEADTESLMLEALEAGADIIMLDNFDPKEIVTALEKAQAWASENQLKLPHFEASGGITIETLDAYAATGIDFVSSGSLTNSAPVLDIGLDLRS